MLKIELHAHTGDDPVDVIPYTTFELIDHAAALGYDALAITLHEHQLDLRRFLPYAAERGVVLIPGVERTIEGWMPRLTDEGRPSTAQDVAKARRTEIDYINGAVCAKAAEVGQSRSPPRPDLAVKSSNVPSPLL